MLKERIWWNSWAQFLHRFDLEKPVAYLLEASGPLTILMAQMVTLGQPFVGSTRNRDHWAALADMLDSPEEAKAFARYLKEEKKQ
jgi:hypothetical protein